MDIQKHGGQDNNIKIAFKEDFSVTTNFMGPSKKGLRFIKNNIKTIEHYPPQDFEPYLSNFKKFLFKNNPVNDHLLLGNGASELIGLLINSIEGENWKPSKSDVQFLEYERSATNANKKKQVWNHNSSNLTCLINPNNPTGDYLIIYKNKIFYSFF